MRVYSGWDDERNRSAWYPEYQALDQSKEAFDGVAAYRRVRVSVGEGAATTIENAGLVSGNFFRVVGVSPAEGRFFNEQEDRVPGEYPVIVLTHRFWQTRFDSDPALIGRSVLISGKPYTVLGVTPAEFTGIEPEARYAFYIPLMTFGHILGTDQRFLSQDWHSFHMIGRLKSGVRIEQAQPFATAAARQIATTYAGEWKGLRFTVMRGGTLANTEESAEISMIFAMLNAVVALVLLIACANVANILLARARTRRREIAIRLSLGSGRWRLMRQLLSESLVLGLMGGAVGFSRRRGVRKERRDSRNDEGPRDLPIGPFLFSKKTMLARVRMAVERRNAAGSAPPGSTRPVNPVAHLSPVRSDTRTALNS